MRTRKAYDSIVVFLYATGRERLLPLKFRRSIPYATISTWRSTDYTKYLGHEFRHFFAHSLDNLELHAEYGKIKKTMWNAMRSWHHLKPLIQPLIKEAGNNKTSQKKVLAAINTLKENLGLRRTLKLLGVTHGLYRQWSIEAQFDCFDSYTALCSKRHPHQLAKKEVLHIKKMLSETEFDHWPIVSVASHGLRTGELVASLYTWYKYAKLLGITKKLVGKEKKTVGLIASRPNEYWHVDTTFYPLIDGKEICIAFVMDNYSKIILGFHVSEKRTFHVVKEAIRQSVATALAHPGEKSSTLIADGGSENHNKYVQQFLLNLVGYKVTMLRSLKDIRFSNSPVEAIHRTIKGRYLHGRKFESVKTISRFLEWAVDDYNILRPHYKHRPRTPNEIYYDIPLSFDLLKRKKTAREARMNMNKVVPCLQCSSFNPAKACDRSCEKTHYKMIG